MKIKFVKAYGLAIPGDVKEVRWTVAELLIRRGVAEEVADDKPARTTKKR